MKAFGRVLALILTLTASLLGAQARLPAKLVQPEDLAYAGAFRLPRWMSDQNSFDYGGTALTYYPAHRSLLVVGHDWYQRVAEIEIPAIRNNVTSINDLDRAAIVQPLTDVLAGHRLDVDGDKGNGVKIGGLLPIADGLIVSAFNYYDGPGTQTRSHFKTGLDFSRLGTVAGPYQVGNGQAGFVSGYMTPIPVEWQSALGGSALTGNCCLSIIGRTSLGPSVSAFNPSQVGTSSSVAAKRLLGYPIDHPTLGGCYSKGDTLFNCAVVMGGVIFPPGTRSVLFFGRTGANFCYGEGTSDKTLDRKPLPKATGVIYCYDPSSSDKGTHGYPYQQFVWAYDANDLVAVKAGRKNPWDVRPYATWPYDLPFQAHSRRIMGAAYDPETGRVFLSADHQDGMAPLIHVFTLQTARGLRPSFH